MLKIGARKTYFQNALKLSEQAKQELKQEVFNSKTLHTLFYDNRFRSNEKNTCMVQSRETKEPVKVYYELNSDINLFKNPKTDNFLSLYDLYFYPNKKFSVSIGSIIGKKNFIIENKQK